MKTATGRLSAIVSGVRPPQLLKNVLVLAPVVYGGELGRLKSAGRAWLASVLFCGLSAGAYLLNDVIDIERDRFHPEKAERPVAAGLLETHDAVWAGAALQLAVLTVSITLGVTFLACVCAYVLMFWVYSLALKRVIFLESITLASFYFLRVFSGAAAANVDQNVWLLACSFMFAFVLGLTKRRAELAYLGDAAADHRAALERYSIMRLDAVIAFGGIAVLATYVGLMLKIDASLLTTVPLVTLGAARYLHLVRHARDGSIIEEVLFPDGWLRACVISWTVLTAAIIYGWPLIT